MDYKKLKPEDFGSAILLAKTKLQRGKEYNLVKQELQPYIDEMNRRGKEIAKEHGTKFKEFTFTYLVR
jgi:hypothetical protein